MKRVYIVHGWDGHPGEGWFPWLKKQLEERGFVVTVPQLPDAENPRIDKWVSKLAEAVQVADKNTYFVGHSLGCQAIARYLETLPEGNNVGGAVFVAGFFKHLTGLESDPDVQETYQHWIKAAINFEKVISHLPKSIAIFSDNDHWVPLDNQEDFKSKLNSKILIEHKMGHFSSNNGVTELPSALEAVISISET